MKFAAKAMANAVREWRGVHHYTLRNVDREGENDSECDAKDVRKRSTR